MEEMEFTLTNEEFNSLKNRLKYEAENWKYLLYEKLTEQKNLRIPEGDRILLPLERFLEEMFYISKDRWVCSSLGDEDPDEEVCRHHANFQQVFIALQKIKEGICVELVEPVAELIFEMWEDFFKDK
jgi:hypothetical protein